MNFAQLGTTLALATAIAFTSIGASAQPSEPAATQAQAVQLQQIRNATVKITYADTTFLIDPMLAQKGAYPGFEGTHRSELRNPLVELPMSVEDVLAGVDAVIVTHTHLDHWDEAAQQALPKNIPLFAQNQADAQTIRSQGFEDVRILESKTEFGGVTLSKTGGQHGTDAMYAIAEVAGFLGDAMGVVFESPDHQTLYLVGDTIWRDEVDQTLAHYNPEVIVINAGYALLDGFEGSIIMGKDDVVRAAEAAPQASIIAIHMDAINHMSLTRAELKAYVAEKELQDRVEVPEDGAVMEF